MLYIISREFTIVTLQTAEKRLCKYFRTTSKLGRVPASLVYSTHYPFTAIVVVVIIYLFLKMHIRTKEYNVYVCIF